MYTSMLISERQFRVEFYQIEEIHKVMSDKDSIDGCIVFEIDKETPNIKFNTNGLTIDVILTKKEIVTEIVCGLRFVNDIDIQNNDYLIIFSNRTASSFKNGDEIKLFKEISIDEWEKILTIWIKPDIEFISAHLNPGDVYFDVGANTGILTKLIIDNLGGNYDYLSKLVLFEPIEKYYSSCVDKFGKIKNIQIEQIALSDDNKDKEICASKFNLGFNQIYKEGLYLHEHERFNIKCVKLDDWIKDNHHDKIDFIKIDAEGHDTNIIKGMYGWLKETRTKPKIMFEYGWNKDEEEEVLRELINSHSYELIKDVTYRNIFLSPHK